MVLDPNTSQGAGLSSVGRMLPGLEFHPSKLAPLPLLQDTIDTLVQASSLPLSILIVGIGESPELSKMEVRVLCVYRICTARVLPIQLWRQLLLHARFSLQCFSSRSCSC